jgi:hypothetical protein
MEWWHWPFFSLGVVTTFWLAVVLAFTAFHLARGERDTELVVATEARVG